MLDKLTSIIKHIFGIFDTNKDGASMRKVIAFTLLVEAVRMLEKYDTDRPDFPKILTIVLSSVAFFLGMILTEQIIQFIGVLKGGKSDTKITEINSTEIKTTN